MAHDRTMDAFSRSESGSALIMVSLAAFLLLAAAGMAIDLGRVQVVQSRLSSALDSAGLAAGTVAHSGNIQATTWKYFTANFPPGYMGSVIETPSVVANPDNTVLTLDVQGTVPTTFMKLFGISSMPVSAHSQITRANLGMELVLVFDVTGSMLDPAGGGQTKLQAAKNASNTLLDILYGTNTSLPNLWVSLVPFAQAVNIGTSHADWLDSAYAATLNWGPTSWMGCVEARTNGSLTPKYDISDDPPSIRPFRPYYAPCSTGNYPNRWYGTNSSRNNCLTGSGLQYQSGLGIGLGPNKYCTQAIQPMTASKNTVTAAVNSLQATGGTHISLGLAWAWRLLSPRWRTLWGSEMNAADLPLDYQTPLMNKVVVLMTDGDNTLYGTNSTGTPPSFSGLYTAFGFPGQNWLAVSPSTCTSGGNCTVGQNELNARTLEACSSMKAQGILIYTVAFGTSVNATSQTMLQNCASKPEYYFYSPTGSSLQTAFQTIGDSLANLRISQ